MRKKREDYGKKRLGNLTPFRGNVERQNSNSCICDHTFWLSKCLTTIFVFNKCLDFLGIERFVDSVCNTKIHFPSRPQEQDTHDHAHDHPSVNYSILTVFFRLL